MPLTDAELDAIRAIRAGDDPFAMADKLGPVLDAYEEMKADRDDLAARLARSRTALAPFADFLAWLEAAREVGDLAAFDDGTVVAVLMAGGGSAYLRVGDLRRAREAMGPGEADEPGF